MKNADGKGPRVIPGVPPAPEDAGSRPSARDRRVVQTCPPLPAKPPPSGPVRKASGQLGRVTPAVLMGTVPLAAP